MGRGAGRRRPVAVGPVTLPVGAIRRAVPQRPPPPEHTRIATGARAGKAAGPAGSPGAGARAARRVVGLKPTREPPVAAP